METDAEAPQFSQEGQGEIRQSVQQWMETGKTIPDSMGTFLVQELSIREIQLNRDV